MIEFRNVSNPAAFGVEWTGPETGTTYQLVNARGMTSLMFAMRPAGATEWTGTQVNDPSRFGLTGPPVKWEEVRAIAELLNSND